MAQDALVVIPARMASRRLPGKPLLRHEGRSLVQIVYENACRWERAFRVVVLTEDREIVDEVQRFGGEVCLTGPARHGSDRAFQYAALPGSWLYPAYAMVNIQGDEPDVTTGDLDRVLDCLGNLSVGVATLATDWHSEHQRSDPNEVGVVCDTAGRAVYFSRQPLPASFRHAGIYAFRRGTISDLAAMGPTVLSKAEGLEQLEWLGQKTISVARTPNELRSINSQRDWDLYVLSNQLRETFG